MGLNEKFFKSAAGGGIVADENFIPVLYDSNGGTKIISNLNFAPDLVWIKPRDFSDNNNLFDTIRGATKVLISNGISGESAQSNTLQEFRSDGFKLGGDNNTNPSGNKKLVAWCFKAASSSTSGTGSGGASSVTFRANVAAGFSIVQYTKSGTTGTMTHGLDAAPSLIIEKKTNGDQYWHVRVEGVTNNNQVLYLNQSSEKATNPNNDLWTTPTTSVFGYNAANNSAGNYIAYLFHNVSGYQSIGGYTSGSGDTTITTNFQPRFLMVKCTSHGGSWVMLDALRSTSNPRNIVLYADGAGAESTSTALNTNFTSTGFTITGKDSGINQNGRSYIYLAIA